MASTETLIEYLLDKGDIDSLIHVGGHHGEEIDFYSSYNLKKVIYFEPVKAFSEIISNKINKKNLDNFEVYNLGLGAENVDQEIFIADGTSSDSTSLLEPRPSDITFSNKEKVKIRTFKSLNLGKIDLGIIDTQGFELEVLKGLEEEIYNFKYLVVEFNVSEGYIGQVVFSDLDNYLSNKSFTRIKTVRKINQKKYNDVNYGDAIYINNKLISNLRVNYQKISNKFFDSFLYRMILILRDIPFHKKQIKKIIKRS